jgi:hypothetical protein
MLSWSVSRYSEALDLEKIGCSQYNGMGPETSIHAGRVDEDDVLSCNYKR